MSAFREAVEQWNERFRHDGYRSEFVPTLKCENPKCQAVGMMVTTIHGETRARCSECEYAWILAW